ncbi:MAG: molybdopterin-dependent oxidoreductase, partial [Gammaproteobacteria bacterium]
MTDELYRRERFPSGLAHLGLDTVEREIPSDEPPALAANAELNWIGKAVPRWDAREKVTGTARYTVDIHLPGMLHAAVLRSPYPHARIKSIDISQAEATPGVQAVLRLFATDVPDEEVFVRYAGQAIVAVAADTPELARQVLQSITIDYEPLPFFVDLASSKQAVNATVYENSDLAGVQSAGLPAMATDYELNVNVLGPTNQHSRGDIHKGFAEAAVIAEGRYQTQVQTHCCMEPHAIVASWGGDALEIWMSTQFTAGVRAQFARQFDLPLARVRVHANAIGGGFGSKSQMSWYGRTAAELSRLAGAPVRLVYHRDEEQLDSGNRSSSEQALRIGARADGTLSAIQLQSYGSAGTAFNAGVGAIAAAMYQCT